MPAVIPLSTNDATTRRMHTERPKKQIDPLSAMLRTVALTLTHTTFLAYPRHKIKENHAQQVDIRAVRW